MEFIVSRDETIAPLIQPDKTYRINDKYEIWYYDDDKLPPISVGAYSYAALPKCLEPIENGENFEKSGITRLQRQFIPGLYGEGVLVAVIDTGINYDLPVFINEDRTSKIQRLWDMENDTTYSKEEITASLGEQMEMLERDTNGHGTFISSVIVEAAPEAELLVVKLKAADKKLRDFYFIEKEDVYSDADIMIGISKVLQFANQINRPLVICIALGCNNGSHNGSGNLCDYIDSITAEIGRAVVVGTGNEALERHHYYGTQKEPYDNVEIYVERDMVGFYLEMWVPAPDLFILSVVSPSGESNPAGVPVKAESGEYSFLLEGTKVDIQYRLTGRISRDLLIFVRFTNVVKGIWNLRIFPQKVIAGDFHIWLPCEDLLPSKVEFVTSNPDTTLTMPSDANAVISTGGYDARNDAVYLDSGRGDDLSGRVKPDFLSPAVEVYGVDLRGNTISKTGSSCGAAIASAVCALFLEWAIVRENFDVANGVDAKNTIIRDCRRKIEEKYPNKIAGFGLLNGFLNLDV